MISTEPKKSKSLMLFVMLLFVLVALMIIFALNGYNKPKPIVNNTNNDNQRTDGNAQKVPQPIIPGWKVYENKAYGFRVDYPSDWRVRENKKDSNSNMNVVNLISPDLLNPNDPQILESDKEQIYERIRNFYSPSQDDYFTYNSDISIRQYSSLKDVHGANSISELTQNNNEISVIGKTKIGGVDATEVIWGGEGEEYVIITENNGFFYDVVLNRISSKNGISATLKQIISSFQFIK